MISTIILTKNEEKDLPICLASLHWCDDIHVLDSGSVDQTLKIAAQYDAMVWHHPFDSFGKQRNYALENITLKYDWVLFLDADEVSTLKFQKALLKAVHDAGPETAGFYLCWKMILNGVWLKKCDNFPKWQFRLLRKGRASFTDFGHGQKENQIKGKIEYIKEPYLHFSLSKGWSDWTERHNKYSNLEAIARHYNCPPLKNMFDKHGSVRNPALKSWLSKIPGWPLIRFFHSYIFNLGFIEGTPGLIYCINIAYHEFLIQIKISELKNSEKISVQNKLYVNKFNNLSTIKTHL